MLTPFLQRLEIIADIRQLLNEPLSYERAVETIRRRLDNREDNFLRLARERIYACPRSPYLKLLKHAGCEYGDLEAETRRHGVEGVLRRLKEAGVWVGFEEFKGRKPIERGALSFQAHPKDFDNPKFNGPGLSVSTGGSSGPSVFMRVACDYIRERAPYEHLMAQMLESRNTPIALWLPRLPASSGMMFALLFAHCGFPPRKWFATKAGGNRGLQWLTNLIAAASRGTRNPIPFPISLDAGRPEKALDWILAVRGRGSARCIVRVYVSGAVRICQEAKKRGVSLDGTVFMVGGEPATPPRVRLIEESGARCFSRYQSTEAGSIAMGCGDQRGRADHHLNLDTLAVIPEEGQAGGPTPFLITSFILSAPKILLNVEQGDACVIEERDCGCVAGELGLRVHLTEVGSYTRATTEGMALPFAFLGQLAEEDLPARFGGSALQYQWREIETENGASRWRLRIDPALDGMDEKEVLGFLYNRIGQVNAGYRLEAEIWRSTEAIQIARETPEITARGKTLPVLRKGAVKSGNSGKTSS